MAHDLREQISQQLIDAISNGIEPWKRPWRASKNAGAPANVQSGRSYTGINPLILDLHAMRHGFESRWWGTLNQWNALGGRIARRPDDVPPGKWGCHVVYYKPIDRTRVNADTGELEDSRFYLMKSYTVFNAEQVIGPAVDKYRAEEAEGETTTLFDFAPAEQLIKASGATIEYGEAAFYVRPEPFDAFPNHTGGDVVILPPKSRFEYLEDFYTTAFHEISHHAEVRVGWDHRIHGYELGELVAETASCYVAKELGMPVGSVQQHGAYLRHWLSNMRKDPGYIFRACSQASKVTDYLLSKMNSRGTVEPRNVQAPAEV